MVPNDGGIGWLGGEAKAMDSIGNNILTGSTCIGDGGLGNMADVGAEEIGVGADAGADAGAGASGVTGGAAGATSIGGGWGKKNVGGS
jgi:hypothetical protein